MAIARPYSPISLNLFILMVYLFSPSFMLALRNSEISIELTVDPSGSTIVIKISSTLLSYISSLSILSGDFISAIEISFLTKSISYNSSNSKLNSGFLKISFFSLNSTIFLYCFLMVIIPSISLVKF